MPAMTLPIMLVEPSDTMMPMNTDTPWKMLESELGSSGQIITNMSE